MNCRLQSCRLFFAKVCGHFFSIRIIHGHFFAGLLSVKSAAAQADIEVFEPENQYGKQWCWVFWSCEIPLDALAGSAEICARAWDDSQNCMPALSTWTLMGMMNNPWFRVKVHQWNMEYGVLVHFQD